VGDVAAHTSPEGCTTAASTLVAVAVTEKEGGRGERGKYQKIEELITNYVSWKNKKFKKIK